MLFSRIFQTDVLRVTILHGKRFPMGSSPWIMLFIDDPNVGMNALFLVSMGSSNPWVLSMDFAKYVYFAKYGCISSMEYIHGFHGY